jgi:hypothetical protein
MDDDTSIKMSLKEHAALCQLIRVEEREACAQIADISAEYDLVAYMIAKKIRARGVKNYDE